MSPLVSVGKKKTKANRNVENPKPMKKTMKTTTAEAVHGHKTVSK